MSDTLADVLQRFESELTDRASRCGWSAVPNTKLVEDKGVGGLTELLSALPGAHTEPHDSPPFPHMRRAWDLKPAAVSLLLCGLDVDKPDESYRSALWWTGLVRAEMAPTRRSDLHLFLIGPGGSCDDELWVGRRDRIESDERFCRKFVWLPSSHPEKNEIDSFLDRTFLAQPWAGTTAEPRALDPLDRLVDEADLAGALSAEEARAWVKLLGSLEASKAQIAEVLVSILEGTK